MRFVDLLIVKFEYFLMQNSYRLPFYYMNKYGFPSKRLVKYSFNNFKKDHIENRVEAVAHMYAFDKTINRTNLELIKTVYFNDPMLTDERVRQYLCKFVRRYYK